MPNRDGTGPQGNGPSTGAKMWSCESAYGKGRNVPFVRGQWPRCGEWMRKWRGNRWMNAVEQAKEKDSNEKK